MMKFGGVFFLGGGVLVVGCEGGSKDQWVEGMRDKDGVSRCGGLGWGSKGVISRCHSIDFGCFI